MQYLSARHPGTQQIMRWFTSDHLTGDNAEIARACEHLAWRMLTLLPDDPELVAGLRKLVEAKDCFVRANVAQEQAREGSDGG